MARTHQVQAKNGKGEELAISSHESDAPILPIAQLEKLQQFRPDLVDFIIEQTKAEAEFRRATSMRINWFVFIERMIGMLCALLIGASGIVGGIYIGSRGQPWLGGVIASLSLGTLALGFLAKKNISPQQNEIVRKQK